MGVEMEDKERIWNKACEQYLSTNHFCDECDKRGYIVPAEHVRHIRNPKGNQALFWDMNNWQAVCITCHRRLVGTAPLKIPNPIPKDAQLYTVK